MSIFKNIFGDGSQPARAGFWKEISGWKDLNDAVQASYARKVVIFKHSTRCMISKTVLKNFEADLAGAMPDADFYFLDLLAHRDISDKIETEFGIAHQSPQMLVIKDGKAIHNASHQGISARQI